MFVNFCCKSSKHVARSCVDFVHKHVVLRKVLQKNLSGARSHAHEKICSKSSAYRKNGTQDPERTQDPGPYEDLGSCEGPGPYEEPGPYGDQGLYEDPGTYKDPGLYEDPGP